MSSTANEKALQFWENRYNSDPNLGSGVGSKQRWKQRKLDAVAELVKRHNVKKILDIGCGDLQVMRDFPDLSGYEYLGIDFSETVIERNRKTFPDLQFRAADLDSIRDLSLETPDLVICFDLLFHIQNDGTYDRICDFMFNCGAKAVALTCAVGREESNDINLWYRDFWKHADRLQLGYVQKVERPFRLPCERLVTFDLCDVSMDDDLTEVVYVCSPDREEQLLVSLNTLLRSGRGFDRIVIFCVGPVPSRWKFDDSRIIVKSVPPLFADYFYGNKLYLCTRSATRIVFLDTDTMIQRPLHLLWEGKNADLIARVGTAYDAAGWSSEVWKETFESAGTSSVPMLNAGLLVFQNHAHTRIHNEWLRYIQKYLSHELTPPCDDVRMPEQWALALAVGSTKLSYSLMSAADHACAWAGDSCDACVVFHTGNELYDDYKTKMGHEAEPLGLVVNGTFYGSFGAEVDQMVARCARKLKATTSGLRPRLSSMRSQMKRFFH